MAMIFWTQFPHLCENRLKAHRPHVLGLLLGQNPMPALTIPSLHQNADTPLLRTGRTLLRAFQSALGYNLSWYRLGFKL